MITFHCTCGREYTVKDELAGRKAKCKCGAENVIPNSTVKDGVVIDTVTVDAAQVKSANTKNKPTQNGGSRSTSAGSQYGNHSFVKTFAKGGMGQISLVVDENLHREIALKELFAAACKDEIAKRRFVEEAEITAQLEHPGIVPIHALGTDVNGAPYYTMKLVKGKTLKEAIKEYHDLPQNEKKKRFDTLRTLIRQFASVCQTMGFAHSRNIIHRDLKPANIMVGEFGEILVMDWGLAKPIADSGTETADISELNFGDMNFRPDLTGAGEVLGTPAYMPPEQAKGDQWNVNTKSDIYGLGAILYHIIAGVPPFSGGSVKEIVEKVINGKLEKPTNPDITTSANGLYAICDKAMAHQQEYRYKTATALATDLLAWLEDEPIAAKEDTRLIKTHRWIRKNRTFATVIAASVVLFFITLTASAISLERAKTQTVAANLLAENLRQRANEAAKLAKEKETQLKEKESELAKAYTELANVVNESEEEREKSQKKINTLTNEIVLLKTEISTLNALSVNLTKGTTDVTSADEPNVVDLDADLRDRWQKVEISRLIMEIPPQYQKMLKQVEGTWIARDEIVALQGKCDKVEDKSQKDKLTNQIKGKNTKNQEMFYKSCEERYKVWQEKETLLELMTEQKMEISPEILKMCDALPFDWDVLLSKNGVSINGYAKQKLELSTSTLAGRKCEGENCVFAHADSKLDFDVPNGCNRFTAVCGMNTLGLSKYGYSIADDNGGSGRFFAQWGTWTYQVWFDGKLAYESEQPSDKQKQQFAIYIDVEVPSGAKTMTLRTDAMISVYNDHTVLGWAKYHIKEVALPQVKN